MVDLLRFKVRSLRIADSSMRLSWSDVADAPASATLLSFHVIVEKSSQQRIEMASGVGPLGYRMRSARMGHHIELLVLFDQFVHQQLDTLKVAVVVSGAMYQ